MFRFFVGIDIAKARHEVAVVDDRGELQRKPFSIPNSGEGFDQLRQCLSALASPQEIRIALEATGPYGWPLQYRLRAGGFDVVVVNPLQTAAFAKTRIRRTKTDAIDAVGIAQGLRVGIFSAAIIPDEQALRLRELTRYRHAVIALLGRFRNLLGSRVYRVFPEFAESFDSLWAPTPLGLLEKYPVPSDLLAVSSATIAGDLRRFSRGRTRPATAEKLRRCAEHTIGLPIASDVYGLEIRGIAHVIRTLQAHVDDLEQNIEKHLADHDQPLTSIPGIGVLSAAAILGEIVDVRHFAHPKKLVAFAGFDPSTFQTGQFLGDHARLSKRGSPHLRYAVWNAAFAAMRFNPELRAYYLKKRQQGKHHKSALAAACRKLLHLVWRLLTDNPPYEVRPMPH